MLPRVVAQVARSSIRTFAPCVASSAPARCVSEWLQGRPPTVSHSAGTIAAFYYKNIRESPIPTKDYVAAFGQDVKMTAEQFDRQVYAYALGMLEAWGLKQGHKIGVWCTNELESVVAQYAAALIGIEVIVMDPVLSFAAVKQLINAEGIRALIISPRFGGEDRHTELAKQFKPELEYTALSAGYSPLASKRFRSLKYLACTGKEFVDGVMRFNELPVYGANGAYAHDDIAAVQTYVKPSQTAFTYYGAGADSDTPVKTRVATHADVVASAAGAAQALAVTGSDVILTTAPVWTFAGLTASFLAGGASSLAKVVLAGKSFDAADALAAAELHRPTLVVSTPEHVAAMSAEAAADAARPEGKKLYDGALARLRAGLVVTPAGAAASAPGLLAAAKLAPVEASKGVAKR